LCATLLAYATIISGFFMIGLFTEMHAPLFAVLGAFALLLPSLAFCVVDTLVPSSRGRKLMLITLDIFQLRHGHALLEDDQNMATLHTLQLIFGTLIQMGIHIYATVVRGLRASDGLGVPLIMALSVAFSALYSGCVLAFLLEREKQEWVMEESPVTVAIIVMHVAADSVLHILSMCMLGAAFGTTVALAAVGGAFAWRLLAHTVCIEGSCGQFTSALQLAFTTLFVDVPYTNAERLHLYAMFALTNIEEVAAVAVCLLRPWYPLSPKLSFMLLQLCIVLFVVRLFTFFVKWVPVLVSDPRTGGGAPQSAMSDSDNEDDEETVFKRPQNGHLELAGDSDDEFDF